MEIIIGLESGLGVLRVSDWNKICVPPITSINKLDNREVVILSGPRDNEHETVLFRGIGLDLADTIHESIRKSIEMAAWNNRAMVYLDLWQIRQDAEHLLKQEEEERL